MTGQELLEKLANDPIERLRWVVLRSFGVFPVSPRAKKISDRRLIICGAHMVIDSWEKSESSLPERCTNGGFDEIKFFERQKGIR